VVVFLTARDLVVVEDISWVVRYAVFVIISGVVIRGANCLLERQRMRLALGQEWGDVEAGTHALDSGTV